MLIPLNLTHLLVISSLIKVGHTSYNNQPIKITSINMFYMSILQKLTDGSSGPLVTPLNVIFKGYLANGANIIIGSK